MGTGNFFGYMPKEIMDGAKLYGVELDTVTGRIASKLYPQTSVQIKGFEETNFPNDYFDIVVSNVSFGGYGVYDSEYSRHKFLIHDYFIAKSIDKVKPGGIVAVVTSKGTLDKLNSTARKYMAERAELLGAIRLPNTAFRQTANTEAVTDILFFKKRAEKISDTSGIEWLGTGKTEDGFEVNNYFIRHPEMVLGTFVKETGLYGAEGLTAKPDGRPLSEAIAAAVENLPQNVYENPDHAAADVAAMDDRAVFNVRPMCYAAVRSKLYMRVGDRLVLQEIPAFPKDAYSRIEGMIGIRDELRRVLDMQTKGCTDEELKRAQSGLSARYDSFVRKYGFLNGQTKTATETRSSSWHKSLSRLSAARQTKTTSAGNARTICRGTPYPCRRKRCAVHTKSRRCFQCPQTASLRDTVSISRTCLWRKISAERTGTFSSLCRKIST